MTFVKQAFIELVFLTLASVGVALAANQMRDRGRIQLTKNYFEKGPSTPVKTASKTTSNDAAPPSNIKNNNTAPAPVESRKLAPDTAAPATENVPAIAPAKKLEHDYQTITVDEAHEVLDDAGTEQGLNVFVDARNEEQYAEGHIPGAIQCFPYESERCLDRVIAAANGAEKVIVYCGGGDCEDSIFMCRELVEAGVPHDALYLFEGGWKEWSSKGLHAESGSP